MPRARTLPPARAAALDCLRATLAGADVQAALDQSLRKFSPDPKDAALATELAYGYLRLGLRLDFILSRFLDRPDKLHPKLGRILGLAAYELLFLDKVPAYASVDWAANAAFALGGKKLSGLANAVLRNLERNRADALAEEFYGADGCPETTRLSRLYSCPQWIVDLWFRDYGRDAALELLAAQAQAPPVGVRLNPAHAGAQDLVRAIEQSGAALAREGHGFAFARLPEAVRQALEDPSLAVRQSLAAQQCLARLNPESLPTPVWDACAGRGGKSLLLAEAGVSPVWASDVSLPRLKGLRGDMAARCPGRVLVFKARADLPAPLAKPVGTLLVDAPCSGLGVLSRRPDSKWKRTPEDVASLARLQARILGAASAVVRPGGLVAYLTCTLARAENQDVVRAFLADNGDFQETERFATPAGQGLGERFWMAVLRRK